MSLSLLAAALGLQRPAVINLALLLWYLLAAEGPLLLPKPQSTEEMRVAAW